MIRWRVVFLCLGGLALLLAAAAWWLYSASQAEPEFYAVALATPVEAQAEASDEAITQATELANRVQQTGRWEATFTQEQVNGWLAVDLPNNHASLLPEGMSEPRAELTADGLTLACRWQSPQFSTVLSLSADVYLHERNVLALRFRDARAGGLPMPMSQVLDRVGEAAADFDLVVQWQQAEGDPVALVTLPELETDDAGLVQVETIELRDGAIYLAGSTREVADAPRGSPPRPSERHLRRPRGAP